MADPNIAMSRTESPATQSFHTVCDVMDDIRRWLGGPGPTRHAQRATAISGSKGRPAHDELGPVTAKWDYLDEAGRLIACVYRYDPPGGKQFRPWDVRARKARAPDPRPLYNRPGIKAADEVILVEGEKAAQALTDQGFAATTAMNGASAPVEKTDWSPLKGRRVLVWPDRDEHGWRYALAAAQALLEAGAASAAVLRPPDDRPEKQAGRRGCRGAAGRPQPNPPRKGPPPSPRRAPRTRLPRRSGPAFKCSACARRWSTGATRPRKCSAWRAASATPGLPGRPASPP